MDDHLLTESDCARLSGDTSGCHRVCVGGWFLQTRSEGRPGVLLSIPQDKDSPRGQEQPSPTVNSGREALERQQDKHNDEWLCK